MRLQRFTLVELMVVLAIILLVAGIAVGRLGVAPVSASREKTLLELESFFARAARSAAVRGTPLTVVYHPAERLFECRERREAAAGTNCRFQLPEELPAAFATETRFICRPDGTTAGPEIRIAAGDRIEVFRFPPLTGQLLCRTEERP